MKPRKLALVVTITPDSDFVCGGCEYSESYMPYCTLFRDTPEHDRRLKSCREAEEFAKGFSK